MRREVFSIMGIITGAASLLCWIVMFMAGTDVWHDIGRPELWSPIQPPYPDVRVFLWAYYLLFPVLLAHVTFAVIGFQTAWRQDKRELTR